MAMSRSIGGRLLTILSSIRIRPEVIDSSPATMRNVVVLPQPDGPTRTTNSLSRTSRLTSLTTWVSSNFLFRFRMTTCAMPPPPRPSSLHGAGQAGDVVLDEERIDQRHRDRAEQRPGHQRAPEEH